VVRSKDVVEIVPIGSFVNLVTGGEPQRAQVTAVQIRERNKVTYEVVWWSGATRSTAWVESCEVTALGDDRPVAVGFADPRR
jgi:hypothetical protein